MGKLAFAVFRRLALVAALVLLPGLAAAQAPPAKPGDARPPAAAAPLDDRDPKLAAIERHHGGIHKLPGSKTTVKIAADFDIMLGPVAQRYFATKNGWSAVGGLEAVLVHLPTRSTIYAVTEERGYVSLENWSSADSARLLKDMRATGSVANLVGPSIGIRTVTLHRCRASTASRCRCSRASIAYATRW
jgi:hypothetical protein